MALSGVNREQILAKSAIVNGSGIAQLHAIQIPFSNIDDPCLVGVRDGGIILRRSEDPLVRRR